MASKRSISAYGRITSYNPSILLGKIGFVTYSLPKSSHRTKLKFQLVIKTATAFSLSDETGCPAKSVRLSSFSKRAGRKIKGAFRASLKELSSVSGEATGAKREVLSRKMEKVKI